MLGNHDMSKALHGIGTSSTRGTKRTADSIYDEPNGHVWKQKPSPIQAPGMPRPRNVTNPYNSMASGRNSGNRASSSNPTASMTVTDRPHAKRKKAETSDLDGVKNTLPSKYYGVSERDPSSWNGRAVPSITQAGPSTSRSIHRLFRADFDREPGRGRTVALSLSNSKLPPSKVISIDESESEADKDSATTSAAGTVRWQTRLRAASESRDEIDLLSQPFEQPTLPDDSRASCQYGKGRITQSMDAAEANTRRLPLENTVPSSSTSSSRPIRPRRPAEDGESTKRLDEKLRAHIPRETSIDVQEILGSSSGSLLPPATRVVEVEDEIEDLDGSPSPAMASSSKGRTTTQLSIRPPSRSSTAVTSGISLGRVREMTNQIEEKSKESKAQSNFIRDLRQMGPSKSKIGGMKGKKAATKLSNRAETTNFRANIPARDKLATARTPYDVKFALPLEVCIWGRQIVQLDGDKKTDPDYWLCWNGDVSELQIHKHPVPDVKSLSKRIPVQSIKSSIFQASTITASGASDFHLLRIDFEGNSELGLPGDVASLGLTFKVQSQHSNTQKYWESLIARIREMMSECGKPVETVKGKSAIACLQLAKNAITFAEHRPRGKETNVMDETESTTVGAAENDDADTSLQRKHQPRPRPAHGKSQTRTIDHMWETRTTRQSSRLLNEVLKQEQEKSPPPDADEIILVYPPSGQGAVNITNGDLRRLEPSEFLNDTLIELGLKFWLQDLREKQPELAESVHVFSSFFFKKLASKSNKTPEDGHKSVRKWTAKVDIFKKKFIIIPINENIHWYLAIIYQPEHILEPALPKPPRRTSKRISNAASPEQLNTSRKDADGKMDENQENGIDLRREGEVGEIIPSSPVTGENDSEAEAEVEGLVDDAELRKRMRSCSLEELPITRQLRESEPLPNDEQLLKNGYLKPASGVKDSDIAPNMDVDQAEGRQSVANGVVDDSLSEDSDEEIDQLDEDDVPSMVVPEDSCSATRNPSSISVPQQSNLGTDERDLSPMDVDEPTTDSDLRYPSSGPEEAAGNTGEVANQKLRGLTWRSDQVLDKQDDRHEANSHVPAASFYGASGSTLKTYQDRKRSFGETLPLQSKGNDEPDELDVLSHPGPERQSSEELEVTERPRTIIFGMDSLGSSHPRALGRLNEYLQEEAKDKKGIANPSAALTKKALVPTQPNFCDCGLYLLHFAQTFVTDPEKYKAAIFSSKKGSVADRNVLWRNEEVGTMREKMRERILAESETWKKLRAEKEKKELESKSAEGVEPAKQPIEVEHSDDEIEVSEVRHVDSPKKLSKKAAVAPPTPAARLR